MPHCGHPFSDFLLDGSLQPIINQFAASGSRGNSHPLRRGLLSIGTGCARRAFLLDRRPQGSILPGDRRAAASPREGPQLAQGSHAFLRKLRLRGKAAPVPIARSAAARSRSLCSTADCAKIARKCGGPKPPAAEARMPRSSAGFDPNRFARRPPPNPPLHFWARKDDSPEAHPNRT